MGNSRPAWAQETPPEKKIFVKQTQAAGTLSLVSAGEC